MSARTDPWRALMALLRPDAHRWLGLGVLMATGSGLALTGPLVVRRLVDRSTMGATTGELARLAAIFLVVAVVTQLIAVGVAWCATVVAWTTSLTSPGSNPCSRARASIPAATARP